MKWLLISLCCCEQLTRDPRPATRDYASILFTNSPCTSVSLKSRPWNL